MAKRRVCVFNQTRQAFLSLDTKVADTQLARLKGLLGRRELKSDEGLWLVPCRGIHTIGLLFPIDVVCVDASYRVVHVIEHLQPFRITSIRRNCHSVLELPLRTVFESETEPGDQLTFSLVSDLETQEVTRGNAERQETSRVTAAMRTLFLGGIPGERLGLTAKPVVAGPPREHEAENRWRKSGYLYSIKPDDPS